MGFLDEAMGSYKPPTSDDLEIALPLRREPREQAKDTDGAGDPRDPGQHGGTADGSPAATEAHGEVGNTGTTAEAAPQRDQPDDGEHTDSTEAQVSARALAAQPKPEEEPVEPKALPADDSSAAAAVANEEPSSVEVKEPQADQLANIRQELAGITGREQRAFQKTGFSTGGVETLSVTRFPVLLVDRLRLSLAPVVGGEFAEALSAPALITAFLVAKTGVDLDVDPNTAVAIDVFRQVDPRLLAVEDKLDEALEDVSRLADAMKLGLQRIGDTAKVVESMEFATSFLVADRVAGLATTDTNETNVDVTQKKVLTARESIRRRSKEQITIERQHAGRRMA